MKVEIEVVNKYVVDTELISNKAVKSAIRYAPFAEDIEDKSNLAEALDSVLKYSRVAVEKQVHTIEGVFVKED